MWAYKKYFFNLIFFWDFVHAVTFYDLSGDLLESDSKKSQSDRLNPIVLRVRSKDLASENSKKLVNIFLDE